MFMICLGEWKKDRDKADTSYAKKILCNRTLECRMAIRNGQSGFGTHASGDYNQVFKYLYKNHLSVYNRGVQATIKERKGDFMAKKADDLAHIQNGCANIISSSLLSIDEKLFLINTKKICGILLISCAVIKG